ncbi:MAG: cutinase family protein [Gordonia sp. (in: high G+C Gram-positive bacteria)]
MTKRIVLVIGVLLALVVGLIAAPAPQAAAARCADVEVVFARGTAENAAPMGATGISFVAAVRQRLAGRSVVGYPVRYPAGSNFDDRPAFVRGVVVGIRDAQRRVTYLAAHCPRTKIVLGGYSQGAAVAGYAANNGVYVAPQYRRYQSEVPPPLPASVATHVRAIVLFAPPSDRWLRDLGAPPMTIGPQFGHRSVRYCIRGDTVCDGSPVGGPNPLHVLYAVNGMTGAGAEFVARHL